MRNYASSAFLMCLLCLAACQDKKTTEPVVETETDQITSEENKEMEEMEEMESDSVFVHTVFFWFNEGFTAEQRTKFEEELGKLAKCESIDEVWYGKAAMTPRDVVDNSYDYAWICHFKNRADQDIYQVDPIHLAFIEQCKAYWKRCRCMILWFKSYRNEARYLL